MTLQSEVVRAVMRVPRPIQVRLLILFGTLALLAVIGGVYYFFLADTSTAFTATMTTSAVRFFAGKAPEPDADDAGLFAPTAPLDIEVVGCARLALQTGGSSGGRTEIDCPAHRIWLSGVQLSSLALAEGTEVTLSVEDGRLHMKLMRPKQLPPGATAESPVRAVLESSAGSGIKGGKGAGVLSEGEWLVDIANVGLELIFSKPAVAVVPAAATASVEDGVVRIAAAPTVAIKGKEVTALPVETDVAVQDGSQMLFETKGRSALLGEKNVLTIARVKDKIALKGSRLELNALHPATIRNLELEWSADRGYKAIDMEVSGRSSELLIYGMYNETSSGEKERPANEALSRFDTFAAGRSTRSLVGGATALVSIPSLFVSLLGLMNGSWDLWEKTRRKDGKKGEGH